MGNQGNRSNYLAAFESANHQLEYIYSEYHELQRRKEKLEGVLSALEPFLQSASNSSYSHDFQAPEASSMAPEPTYAEEYSEPQLIASQPSNVDRFAEPAPAPVFAQAETELDPLQLRINRALGLAVA